MKNKIERLRLRLVVVAFGDLTAVVVKPQEVMR
jgi:hypothetical protein